MSDPQINGTLKGHALNCNFRVLKEQQGFKDEDEPKSSKPKNRSFT